MTRIATEKKLKRFFLTKRITIFTLSIVLIPATTRNCTAVALTRLSNFKIIYMTKKKIINFLIEVAKLAIAFFAGNQVTNL